jgi:hypothetical protein
MSDELNVQPTGDETIVSAEGGDTAESPQPGAENVADSTADDSVSDASSEASESETPSDSDESKEATDEAANEFLEAQANKCIAADPERFKTLQDRFVADEPFEAADIKWISETVGLDEATVAYGLSLQRVAFQAEQAAAKPDTSLTDAEQEFGGIDSLIEFARLNATPEQYSEWAAVQRLAERTGKVSPEEGNNLTRSVLREMKAFKDSIPGNKPKTLGHLAGTPSQPKTETVTPVAPVVEPQVDELLVQLQSYSDMALASIVTNTQADAATRGRAQFVLKQRGVIS